MAIFNFRLAKNQVEKLFKTSSTELDPDEKNPQEQDVSAIHPRRLSRSKSATVIDIVVDVLLLTVSMTFFLLAVVTRQYHGANVNENPKVYHGLSEASKLGATILPIIFATIIGRACKAALSWRLEKGTTIGTLDLLASSTSLSSIVLAQFTLGVFTLLSPALLFTWVLSPIGSQASLRLLYLDDSITPWTFEYMQQNLTFLPLRNGIARGVYQTAVLTPNTIKRSPQDLWGNTKVPMIEQLEKEGSPDDEGWFMVPDNATYASLVGTPIGNIPLTDPTNFSMDIETSYWALDCSELITSHGNTSSGTSTLLGSNATCVVPCFSSNIEDGSDIRDPHNNSLTARHLFYTSWNADAQYTQSTSASRCAIRTTYVQLRIECQSINTISRCAAKKARPSQLKTNPVAEYTWLDSLGFRDFGTNFTNSTRENAIYISMNDMYLIEPDNQRETDNLPSVYALGTELYGLRLGQLLNSYWDAGTGRSNVQLGLSESALNSSTVANSTNGRVVFENAIIRCDNIWMAFLLITAVIMIIGTLLHATLTFVLCHAPDFLNGNISSMLRDNPWVYPRATDSMTYSSAQRAANLAQDVKHLKVMLGDVHEKDEAVGHLAIGLLGSGCNITPITKHRSFY